MKPTPITKEGQYGTLYRFAVQYVDSCDQDNTGTWHCWAYDHTHAIDKFYDSGDDDGWQPILWARLVEGLAHRQTWHKV